MTGPVGRREGPAVPDLSRWVQAVLLLAIILAPVEGLARTEPRRPSPAPRQLAYIDDAGAVRLVNADGSNERLLIAPERCPEARALLWSPAGDAIACLGKGEQRMDGYGFWRGSPLIVDLQGRVVREMTRINRFSWSPAGQHVAYGVVTAVRTATLPYYTHYITEVRGRVVARLDNVAGYLVWSPNGNAVAYTAGTGEVLIHWIAQGRQQRLSGGGAGILGWVLDGKALLVAAHLREGDLACFDKYEASLLSPASGKMVRVPQLDDSAQFWVAPDGARAAFVLGIGPGPKADGDLHVLDFRSLKAVPVKGSVIGYPSEAIPPAYVTMSADGRRIYWASFDGKRPTIYRAPDSGTKPAKLAEIPGFSLAFSPDLTKLAYAGEGTPPALLTSNLDGSDARRVGFLGGHPTGFSALFAWRPPAAKLTTPRSDWRGCP